MLPISFWCSHSHTSSMTHAGRSLPPSARPRLLSVMQVPCEVFLWIPGMQVLLCQQRRHQHPMIWVAGWQGIAVLVALESVEFINDIVHEGVVL